VSNIDQKKTKFSKIEGDYPSCACSMFYKTGSRSISFGKIVLQEIRVFSAVLQKKGLFMQQRYAVIKPF
jgi:hypothetical protein